MATKYDTNPLDPDFPEKVKAKAEQPLATQGLPYTHAGTQTFPYSAPTEEQTRRFVPPDPSAFSSPYNGQYVPANYQAAGFANVNQSISRKVDKVGLPENILVALAYFPFSLGLVAGLLELVFVPKHETKVRFHAAQGLAAHIGYLIISAVLGIMGNIASAAETGSQIFQAVATVMFIIFVVKAWKGKPIHIQFLDDLTNWLDEKISPKQ